MALYEHLLIARQDISAQQVDALATHLKTIVEGEGGKVEKQEYWGLRGLAYRIKKNRKGHYVLLNINAPAPAVIELERQLKINEDVLRFMSVKVEQFDTSSNKNKRDREDRKPEGEGVAVGIARAEEALGVGVGGRDVGQLVAPERPVGVVDVIARADETARAAVGAEVVTHLKRRCDFLDLFGR